MGPGIDSNYFQALQSLKQSVIERFKHERTSQLHRVKHLEYLEQVGKLTEEIKKAERAREKKTLHYLNERLKDLNQAAAAITIAEEGAHEVIDTLESLQSRAKALHEDLEAKEAELMSEGELEASLLCEVERLHLLDLLRVFEVEVEWGEDGSQQHKGQGHGKEEEHEELISHLQQRITLLECDLNAKVGRSMCGQEISPLVFDLCAGRIPEEVSAGRQSLPTQAGDRP